MPLSWNEIKTRALAFSKEWEHDKGNNVEANVLVDDNSSISKLTKRGITT